MSSALDAPIHLIGQSQTSTPKFIYGTAWKKDRTGELVYQALKAGFRGIDTAAQPKHYQEALVGDGIRRAIAEGIVKREELYIQTKYTPPSGQDPKNMPYDPSQPIAEQIHISLASSLAHLKTDSDSDTYLDTLLLHSPLSTPAATLSAWETLTSYVEAGKIHNLGISNAPPEIVTLLVAQYLKPAVVQNRFYAGSRYEVELRRLCCEHGIVFQAFWTLTGNPALLASAAVVGVAQAAEVSREVALYALVLGLQGTTVLNGTTSHMQEDLEGVKRVGRWAEGDGKDVWADMLGQLKQLIREPTS